MVNFLTQHPYDLMALVWAMAAVGIYQFYLRRRIRRDPACSALYGMNAARITWVEAVMRDGKDILAVQTLRNSAMASSFMASTAILLIIGVLTLSAQGEKLSDTWHALNFLGQRSADIWLFKLMLLLSDLLFAFFAFGLSIRFYHHIGYLINTPAELRSDITQPAHVGAELNRAANYYRAGMRAFYFIVPLLLWLLGPLWLAGAVVCLLFFFYHLDRAPRSDEDLMG